MAKPPAGGVPPSPDRHRHGQVERRRRRRPAAPPGPRARWSRRWACPRGPPPSSPTGRRPRRWTGRRTRSPSRPAAPRPACRHRPGAGRRTTLPVATQGVWETRVRGDRGRGRAGRGGRSDRGRRGTRTAQPARRRRRSDSAVRPRLRPTESPGPAAAGHHVAPPRRSGRARPRLARRPGDGCRRGTGCLVPDPLRTAAYASSDGDYASALPSAACSPSDCSRWWKPPPTSPTRFRSARPLPLPGGGLGPRRHRLRSPGPRRSTTAARPRLHHRRPTRRHRGGGVRLGRRGVDPGKAVRHHRLPPRASRSTRSPPTGPRPTAPTPASPTWPSGTGWRTTCPGATSPSTPWPSACPSWS